MEAPLLHPLQYRPPLKRIPLVGVRRIGAATRRAARTTLLRCQLLSPAKNLLERIASAHQFGRRDRLAAAEQEGKVDGAQKSALGADLKTVGAGLAYAP